MERTTPLATSRGLREVGRVLPSPCPERLRSAHLGRTGRSDRHGHGDRTPTSPGASSGRPGPSTLLELGGNDMSDLRQTHLRMLSERVKRDYGVDPQVARCAAAHILDGVPMDFAVGAAVADSFRSAR